MLIHQPVTTIQMQTKMGKTLPTGSFNTGHFPHLSGHFDFDTFSQTLVVGEPVIFNQIAGPHPDELEMDQVRMAGTAIDNNTLRVYWTCSWFFAGIIYFTYRLGA